MENTNIVATRLGVNELLRVDGSAVYSKFKAHEEWISAVFAEVASVLLPQCLYL